MLLDTITYLDQLNHPADMVDGPLAAHVAELAAFDLDDLDALGAAA